MWLDSSRVESLLSFYEGGFTLQVQDQRNSKIEHSYWWRLRDWMWGVYMRATVQRCVRKWSGTNVTSFFYKN